MPRPAALCCATAILAAALPAQADLTADVDRLTQQWKARGAEVTRLDPLFLERGRAKTLSTGPSAPAKINADKGCLTFAFLAVRTAEFFVEADDGRSPALTPRKPPSPLLAPLPTHHPPLEDEHRQKSSGGASLASRCGKDRDDLRRLTVEMSSARAAVEVLMVRSPLPLGEIRDVLSERAAGPIAPRGDPGGLIEPGPLPDRLARAERRARNDGAAKITRASMRSSLAGAGEFDAQLTAGCHRLEVMAEVPTIVPRRATDIDAEVRTPDGRMLARDRAEVPDARLDVCFGETTLVEIPFTGASGAVSVTLADAHWPLPAHVPTAWGARATAGFAGALLRRHAPDPKEPPVLETVGVQGVTQIPVEVTRGQCYLAAAALIRGDARTIRLSTRIGDRSPHDDATASVEGAALAFCADTEDTALIEVDARGNAPWWALELWPMGSAAP